jgi:hypothetical protein
VAVVGAEYYLRPQVVAIDPGIQDRLAPGEPMFLLLRQQ